jgi:hypothetical protein
MGMGIGMNRGHQRDCVMDTMGSHVHGNKGKGPKICTWILIATLNNLSIVSHTVHLLLSKVTSPPTFVKTRILNSKAIDKTGIICPIRTKGRPSMCMSHMCVDTTCLPSANVTLSEHVV